MTKTIRHILHLILSSAAAICLASCAKAGYDGQNDSRIDIFTISGTVLDIEDCKPIHGIKLDVHKLSSGGELVVSGTSQTGKDGRYIILCYNSRPGDTLSISAWDPNGEYIADGGMKIYRNGSEVRVLTDQNIFMQKYIPTSH